MAEPTLDEWRFGGCVALLHCWDDRRDEAIPMLKEVLIGGRSSEVRAEAALSLSILMRPEARQAMIDSIDLVPEEDRKFVMSMLDGPLQARMANGKQGRRASKVEALRKSMRKPSRKLLKGVVEPIRDQLAQEFPDTFEYETVPDTGRSGHALAGRFIPKREGAAPVTISVGSQTLRCDIGRSGSAIQWDWVTPLGRRKVVKKASTLLTSVFEGDAVEWVSEDPWLSAARVGGQFDLVASTLAPGFDDDTQDRSRVQYRPYTA